MAIFAGYALARLKFPGKALVFSLILFSLAIPDQITFISNFLVLRDLKLLNMGGVIIVAIAAQQTFIMKQFFESVPKVLEEATILDGASQFQTFWHVVLPLAGPALVAVTIMSFQAAWNDFFWPLVVITSPKEAFALPVGLLSFRKAYGVAGDWGMILAGAIISMLPMLVIFAVFQRYFVENNSNTGIK